MAASAAFSVASPPLIPSSCKIRRPFLLIGPKSFRPVSVRASVGNPSISIDDKVSVQTKTSKWQWKFKGNSIGIHYEEHEGEKSESAAKNILMIPTISDVSTVEEWRSVARDIVQRDREVNWRATIVDWPGLGYSDKLKMDYDTDVIDTPTYQR
ncbi:hypothetical protein Bca52824_013847 [Brassica carinata]|uniref:Uncharacterized protein n=1 Tax=Brassica carinata TaxID=52824 RepID=A0A8X8B1R4_BRACI|nr:hypothetical protein Bca52824_013847 [Brassica carinata]